MGRVRTDTTGRRVAQVSALCIAVALALAVFYHGPQMPLLAGAQAALVIWLVLALASSYANGIRFPLTPLTISLTLFWLWLAVSLTWSAVPVTSVINFWWVGSVALVFWCYTLSPERDRIWFYVSRFVLGGALVLCAFALVQLFAWGEPPRSTFVNIHSFAALMVLIALPVSARFLLALHKDSNKKSAWAFGACLFVLFFTVASTQGRGTALGLLMGMLVLGTVAWRITGARPVLVVGGLLVTSYILANIVLHGGLSGNRLLTLTDPASAGADRFLIWRGSWELLQANRWWGIGLGTYYLAWPPYRDPTDSTLGFFVHNDYLQIWIEAGLPALLSLVAVFVSVLILLAQLLHRARAGADQKMEATGLFCGLLAVAAHSFFDFNLYILPISIVAGLTLGRFHECVATAIGPREYRLQPAKAMQGHAYRAVVVLVALFPLTYFAALGTSDYLYKRAFELAAGGKLTEADNALAWSERLLPSDDKVLTAHADLYRHVLRRLPSTADSERLPIYEAALAMLDAAEAANPYRALVHAVRARIFVQSSDLAGDDWRARAERSYARALALDPRFYSVRMDYASLLLGTGREQEAYQALEAGMRYWYYPGLPVLAYYDFTAGLARRQGHTARASEIERQMTALKESIATMAAARPIVADLGLPTNASTAAEAPSP